MVKYFLSLIVTLTALVFSNTALASHFRYGTIAWTVPNPQAAPLTVKFTVTTAWRAAAIDGTTLEFGDGTNNGYIVGTTIGTGTDTTGQAYVVTEYTATHTYPAAGNYTAFFTSCCRISTLQNGADGNFLVQTFVSLAAGNTGGPVTASTAIIQMQTGGTRTYTFPSFDPDGDAVTCRLATDAEVGFPGSVPTAGGQQPTVMMGPNGCVVTWNLSAATAGLQYVLHIVLESTHGGAVSSTAIDLIVELVSAPIPACAGAGTFIVSPGQMFTTMTTGTNTGGGTLNASTINAPVGSTNAPASGASPLTTTFSWTPGAGDAGTTNIVLVNYSNAQNITGTCALTIQVPQCVGFGTPCSAGVGQCNTAGIIVCAGPNMPVCNAVAGMPTAETCDGLDNDCDGVNDDGNPGSNVACSSGLPGVCNAGLTNCNAGMLQCIPNIMPNAQTETCNAIDDDCDGQADEGFNLGTACSNGVGQCATAGVIACNGMGMSACNAVPGMPAAETCDGLDNDCDGVNDNGNPGSNVACTSGLPGVCNAGLTNCSAGMIQCVPNVMPNAQMETCNALDDDCDGQADEGFNLGTACSNGVGQCSAAGVIACDGLGMAACNAVPGMPAAETCDGLDNDCDGANDNGNPGSGAQCNSGLNGVCSDGLTTCSAGAIQCVANILPDMQMETCNGLDDDCDGVADDGNPDGGGTCMSNQPGICSDGILNCIGGALSCTPNVDPGSQMETCNGSDDDCDGTIDDGFNVGGACTNGVGACITTGIILCDVMGGAACNAVPGMPQTEMCGDAIDSDCDGDANNGCTDTDGDGLSDDYENQIGTDPNDADSDDDGVIDGDEPALTDDTDGDGLINANDPDSDNDGLFDGTEMGFDCANPATDANAGNCIADADMGQTTTVPLDRDTDNGGVSDGSEDINRNGTIDQGELDPNDPSDDAGETDTDGDGLTDSFENQIGTDPNDADSDNDGVIDGQEANPANDTDGDGSINALDTDSDGDGILDGTEVGTDCSNPDTDTNICVPDADSMTTTSPVDIDTDNGGVSEGVEDTNHNGAIDAGETDPNVASDDFRCVTDADCGGPMSGTVCDDSTTQHACVPGCRGTGGNGCPDGEMCSSMDDTIGTCSMGQGGMGGMGGMGGGGMGGGGMGGEGGVGGAGGQAGGIILAGGGCDCSALPANGNAPNGAWLAALALCAAYGARRRRAA